MGKHGAKPYLFSPDFRRSVIRLVNVSGYSCETDYWALAVCSKVDYRQLCNFIYYSQDEFSHLMEINGWTKYNYLTPNMVRRVLNYLGYDIKMSIEPI